MRQQAGQRKGAGRSTGDKGRTGGRSPAREGRPARAERPPRPVPEGPRLGWREAIDATVTGLGYEVVDVERAPKGLLRITIDRVPGRVYLIPSEFVLVEDCEQVTRQLQYALEVEGLDYARLEVSSPGLDRPLRQEADYERFLGEAIKITLKEAFEGRKTWEGVLGRAEAPAPAEGEAAPAHAGWTLTFRSGKTEQVLGFQFDEVREARLVPVVNFKGRKAAVPAAADAEGAPVSPPAGPESDGG